MTRAVRIDGRQLADFLKANGFEITVGSNVQVAQRGSTKVRIPLSTGKREASWSQIKDVAKAVGMSHTDLAAQLGHNASGGKKAGKKAPANTAPGVTAAECRREAEVLRHKLTAVEAWIGKGVHGAALYGRVYAAVHDALRALEDYPPHGDRQAGGYATPDDSAHRPGWSDSLLNGAGRVTGDTAKAVRRGKTYTAHQLQERA